MSRPKYLLGQIWVDPILFGSYSGGPELEPRLDYMCLDKKNIKISEHLGRPTTNQKCGALSGLGGTKMHTEQSIMPSRLELPLKFGGATFKIH